MGAHALVLHSGRVEREDDRAVVLRPRPPPEVATPKSEIVERRRPDQSNRPAGMLDVIREEEILDLLAYRLAVPWPRSPRP